MNRFVITGAGIVSPIGTGNDFWNAVENGTSGIRKLTKFALPGEILCGEIRDFELSDYMPDRRFRRAAPISQYALAAAAMALGESSVNNADTALIMGITHGALGYTQAFKKELLESGPESVSPIYFSDSVLNAPAGNVSLCFGIKGPVHTILGGAESAIKAMITACRLIDEGEAEKAVVVSAEELNELSLFCYTRLGLRSISEGAGAIVIRREDAADKSRCSLVSAIESECNPSDPASALGNCVQRCIDKSGLKPEEIDLIFSDEKIDIFAGVPVGSLSPLAGNAFATSLLWQIILSDMAIQKDKIPQAVITRGTLLSHIGNVMVCMADRNGNASAIILSKK